MPTQQPTTDAPTLPRGDEQVPLCVDLDGTVIKTDMLWEAVLSLVKQNPLKLLAIPGWLIGGRARLKQRIAECSNLDPRVLPYRSEVLELIRTERARGRRIVLVSAAHHAVAEQVAEHLGLFDEVMASDGTTNLKGRTKRKALEERFGHKGFDYVGDHAADLQVWSGARAAYVVSHNARLKRRAGLLTEVTPLELAPAESLRHWLRVLRVHQWSKNLLVLVPILTSHRWDEVPVWIGAVVAFLGFSLVSSSVYLVNDLVDLEADRAHRTKRERAFSSGALNLSHGTAAAVLLLLMGLGVATAGGVLFVAILAGYFAVSFAYSAYLKQFTILDVVILATFYALRIFAGGAATGIGVSVWLLAFSMFFFFSLAMVKRYSELRLETGGTGAPVAGRGYVAEDLPQLSMLGISSGLVSVLVLVLYVRSPEVEPLYRHPHMLLLVCPLLLYWIGRVWQKTGRGTMTEDPVVFALRDRTSYLVGAAAMAIVYVASL
jgi:4-hydroxybenzoate polyprenyltransferase